MKLLYAEDEAALSEAVVDYLTYHKYIVDAVYDGQDAYDYAASGEYDGIILDIMMPRLDGIEVLSRLRRNGCKTPVLLLTAKTQVEDRIRGLDAGADDYLSKPFDMGELLARIQSNNDTMALIHGENKYNVHIRNQTKRLNGLMSNLLTLARLDEETTLPTEKLNISELANELLPVYREEALLRELCFDAHIEQNIIISTNADSFRQMLTILLDNALKYTSEKGRISLSMVKNGKHIQLVTENSCDTSLEPKPERLFERFYRGDFARTQANESSGYGIGLSAARAICENFGGELWAEYPDSKTIRFTAKF